MPVGELLKRISSTEIVEWGVLFKREEAANAASESAPTGA